MSVSHYSKEQEESTGEHFWLNRTLSALQRGITLSNLAGLIGAILALLCLLVLHDPWNYRIPLYLIPTVWILLRPRVALYLMTIAVPWASVDAITIGGSNVNGADILVGLLTASWLMSFTLRSRGVLRPDENEYGPSNVPKYLTFAFLALIGTMLLSMIVAININGSIKEIVKWLEFLILILLGTRYIRTRRQIWTLVTLIILAGISQAIYGYIQEFFNIGPDSFIKDASLRLYGTFGQPNPYAGYLNIPLSIAIALMLLGGNWKARILAGLSVAIIGGAEYLSNSRGGEIAILVTLIFILFVAVWQQRGLIWLIVIGGLSAIAMFFAGLIPQSLFDPLFTKLGLTGISFTAPSNADYSTAERLAHWYAGIRMFANHPFTGVGIGNYPDAYPHYYITIFVLPLGHAHNYYINIAAETGVIGLIAFLLFLFATFYVAGSSYQRIQQTYLKVRAERTEHATSHPETTITQRQFNTFQQWLMRFSLRPLFYERRTISEKAIRRLAMICMVRNDKALAVGIIAALISICIHNLFDDLYVHSVTNLIALLPVILIRLEREPSQIRQASKELAEKKSDSDWQT